MLLLIEKPALQETPRHFGINTVLQARAARLRTNSGISGLFPNRVHPLPDPPTSIKAIPLHVKGT